MWIADHPQHFDGAATIGLELVETVPSFYAVLNEPGVNGTELLIRFRRVILTSPGVVGVGWVGGCIRETALSMTEYEDVG